MERLSNGIISICVKEHGAELSSIRYNGREYLWQADQEFWKRHSPVLFPIVGNVWQKQFSSHGKTYPMGQHGFARDMDFTLLSKTEDQIWYCLESTEQTLEKYPYAFRLEIGYQITGKSVKVMWKVYNPSEEDMYFQIGAHPAFHWPLLDTKTIESGTQAMKEVLAQSRERGWFQLLPAQDSYANSVIGEGGCVDPAKQSVLCAKDGFLPLDTDSFNADAFVLENSQVQKVTLCGQDKTPHLSVEFDAPVVGLWSSPGKNAPFVCIEPWYGRTDDMMYCSDFEHRKWIQRLEAKQCFDASYTITIE